MLRALSAAVAALAVLWCAATPAFAAAPATLTGESFYGIFFGTQSTPASFTFTCSSRPGRLDFSFRASNAVSQGPYLGRYVETGTVVIEGDIFQGFNVTSAKAEFTIDSAAGQVSGTKSLAGPPGIDSGGLSTCNDGFPGMDTTPLPMRYSATITAPDGVFADRGEAIMDFDDQVRTLPSEFRESFTSSLAATEQQHSVLFGKRTPGSSFSAMSANTKRASPFVFYFPGTVRRIHAFIDGRGATSGSQTVRAVLYRRDPATGGPGAYITRSFEYIVPAGMSGRWVPFYLAPPAQLQPGVYWLGLQTGGDHGVARYAWDSVSNARRYNIDSFADGSSDPFGAAFSDDQQLSVFAFGSY